MAKILSLKEIEELVTVLTEKERKLLGSEPLAPDALKKKFLEVFSEGQIEGGIRKRLAQRKKREAAQRPKINPYDFKHPARVNKDQLRTLENLHDNFARRLSSTLSGAMRAAVDVDTVFVDQTTYREYIASLSNPSCSYQFTLGPTNGQAIIDFPMPVVCAFVDRMFGGKGSSQGVSPRTMSQIEMGVMAKILKRVVEDLEATWEPMFRVEVSDIELETNPEFMQITAPSEIVILLAFEVNSTNASGLVSLCYPFFTLESILPRLGRHTYVRHGMPNREQTKCGNRLRLGSMDLPVVAELGRTRIPLSQAASLGVGDVIRLSTRKSDPARVFVGGRPKLLAWPFAESDGEVKLQVAGRLPGSVQDHYGRVDEQTPISFAGKDTRQSWLPAD
jgi:flagellar motor switch protein FliM